MYEIRKRQLYIFIKDRYKFYYKIVQDRIYIAINNIGPLYNVGSCKGTNVNEIDENMSLQGKIGIDSFGLVCMLMDIEDTFNIKIFFLYF